ncbi:sensor histidine kinase [Pedobacter jamesrossensis]|uniref:histidine kinase n=1 Tax=Pedobacter jamesrossensis TaxID=1908238 RepID=A0ABV8NJ75_9SPHI
MKKLIILSFLIIQAFASKPQTISRIKVDSLKRIVEEDQISKETLYALLELAEFNILKTGELKIDLDSAENFIQKATDLNRRIGSVEAHGNLKLLQAYLNKERGLDTKKQFAEAISVLGKTNDKFHLAMAKMEFSKNFNTNEKQQAQQKEQLLMSALQLAVSSGTKQQKLYAFQELKYSLITGNFTDLFWKIDFMNLMLRLKKQFPDLYLDFSIEKEIASTHINQGKLGLAKNELTKLISYYRQNNINGISRIYHLMSKIYFDLGDFNASLSYSLQSVRNIKTKEDSIYFPEYGNRIAQNSMYMRKFDKALEWYIKNCQYEISIKDNNGLYIMIPKVAHCFIMDGKSLQGLNYVKNIQSKYPPGSVEQNKDLASALALLYDALNDKARSKFYHLRMITLSDFQFSTGEISDDSPIHRQMGIYYLKNGDIVKAKKYLDWTINELPQGSAVNKRLFTHLYGFKIDSAYKNYLSAMQQLLLYQRLKDSVYTEMRSRQFAELTVSYETEEKKKDIRLLKETQKRQALEIHHTKAVRKRISIAAVSLFFLLAFSFYQYRMKQKSHKLLESQKENIVGINNDLNVMVIEKDVLLAQKEGLIKEKEWLLREIHHRVKNNLHTVICLLESQAVYLSDDGRKALESSQHRIYAMSLIHQKLYQTENLKTIDMAVYLPELLSYLSDSFDANKRIRFSLDIDKISLGISHAIPIALIVNEAVTNSIKYAFVEKLSGMITINMKRSKQKIKLVIADDGIGIPEEIDNMHSESLGLKLMNGLSGDINANIHIENDNGTRITLDFDLEPLENDFAFFDDTNHFEGQS